jgi:hypothetical protein
MVARYLLKLIGINAVLLWATVVVAYQSTIRRSDTIETIDPRFTNEKIPNGYFLGLGHPEVVEPILHNGPDAWARKIHDQILAETSGTTGPPEKAATWVSAVTQAVIDRAGDPHIGGQVASIISNGVGIGDGFDDPTFAPSIKSRNLPSGEWGPWSDPMFLAEPWNSDYAPILPITGRIFCTHLPAAEPVAGSLRH